MPKDYGYFGKGSSGCFLAIIAVIIVLALLGVR